MFCLKDGRDNSPRGYYFKKSSSSTFMVQLKLLFVGLAFIDCLIYPVSGVVGCGVLSEQALRNMLEETIL